MSAELIGAYDFVLTIKGVDVGFHLHEEGGLKAWREGLAEKYAAQQRTQSFSYEHVPPDVDLPLAGEEFFGGAGYDSVRNADGSTSTARYSYSRGVNASHPRMLMLSHRIETALESDGTAIGASPTAFYYSPTLGMFLGAGRYIYRFDLTTGVWVEKSTTAATANIRSFAEFNGKLFAATGTANDYYYTADGSTWTAFTAEDKNADFFATRSDIMWRVQGNSIQNSTDPTIAGWTGSDKMGHTSMTIAGFVQASGFLVGFYREGIFDYSGSAVRDLWRAPVVRAGNGANPYLHGDGFIYVPYGYSLMRYDPSGETPIEAVYPYSDIRASQEIVGEVTAVAGEEQQIYFAVKNGDGNTYIMKGDPNGNQWHTWVYMGSTDVTALKWVPEGVMHATNPVLLVGTEAPAAGYIILPRTGYTPNTDSKCRFETTGTITFPNWDFGAQAFPKFLNAGNVAGKGITAANTIQLLYDTDNSGSNVSILTQQDNGFGAEDVTTKVSFNVIRPVVTLSAGTAFDTPVCLGFALHATPNPPRRNAWNLTIRLANDLLLNDGQMDNQDLRWVKDMLRLARNDRPTLTSRDGGTEYVIIRDIQGQGIKKVTIGGEERDVEIVNITLVEVTRLTNQSQVAVYGQDEYAGGKVYG